MNTGNKILVFQPDTILVDTPAVTIEEILHDTVTEGDEVVQQPVDTTMQVTVTSVDSVIVDSQPTKREEQAVSVPVVEIKIPAAPLPAFETARDFNKSTEKKQVSTNFLENVPEYESNKAALKDLFTGTEKGQAQLNEAAPIPKLVPDWAMAIIIVSSFFLIWVRQAYKKYLRLILQSFSNYQFSVKLFKDSSQIYNQVSYLLNLNSAIIVGLFLYQVYVYFSTDPYVSPGFTKYLVIPAYLLLLYVIQYVGYYLLGVFFEKEDAYLEYTHHTYTLTKILGIIFLPIVIIVAYIPSAIRPFFIWAGMLMLIVVYLKRLFRGIKIIINHHAFKFQWILYFCTLEILPVLIIIKLASSLIQN